MELLRTELRIDFLRYRHLCLTVSGALVLLSLIGFLYPGPRVGLDFGGGAEGEFSFRKPVSTAELRQAVANLGFQEAEVVEVAGKHAQLLVRVGTNSDKAPNTAMNKLAAGVERALADRGPSTLRMEWVGPRASERLRSDALQALLYAVGLIMVYVTFRFDLRFAPGAAAALIHDVIITAGIYTALRKEITLVTVTALLTVVGYSINDTIVIYDRVRENLQRMRDKSLYEVINISTSQTLSRTLITSATTIVSVSGFFIFGTPALRDLAFALCVGFIVGTYSTVYVASSITELVDKRFFRTSAPQKRPAISPR